MSDSEQQLHSLITFLQLEQHARDADTLQRLLFVIANETDQLLGYRQSAVWSWRGQARVVVVSGVAQIDVNAPYIHWLGDLLNTHATRDAPSSQTLAEEAVADSLRPGWQDYVQGHMLLCPLRTPAGKPLGGLLLIRDMPWNREEIQLLEMLAQAYGHAWAALLPRNRRWKRARLAKTLRAGALWKVAAVLLLASSILPIHQSVLAPASITPNRPMVVASPLDGVISAVEVEPNATVTRGAPLLRMDDTRLRNQLAIAQKAYSVAEAEHLRATQKAFGDPESKASIALLKARMEQKRSEIDYYRELSLKTRVLAPRDGVAIFSDPNDWIGKPVVIGEKIMQIARPEEVQIEIWLPVSDAITLAPGSKVTLFLDTDPTQPLRGVLSHTSYQAQLDDTGVLAFRLLAEIDPGRETPRLGLHGTAKLHGERVPLIYYLLRRPAAAIRQWTGL